MQQNPTDDELRSYLLGKLPDPQAAELEELILKDDELFDLVEGLEAELLAAASRGELASAERKRVLERLASSPEGRERLALARSLNTLADDLPEEKRGEEKMAAVVPFRRRVSKPVEWVVALAAAGLFVAVGLSLYTQYWMPHGGDSSSASITESGPTPTQPKQPKNPPPPDASKQGPAPGSMANKEPAVAIQKRTLVKAPPFVLALTAPMRGSEQTAELSLPSNADIAVIHADVDIDELAGSNAFRATVRREDGEQIWDRNGLKAESVNWEGSQGKVIVLEIPVKRLTPGLYEVAVTGDSGVEVTKELKVVREDH